MRLLLSISRHELPTTKILFPLPEGQTSISRLLELVNDLVPLESEQWGLEDYALTLQGYECLHYQDAHAVLNESDQIDIRPLTSAENRLRKASGRLQVSPAGAHLIDGVAFGRAFSSRSVRPAVCIPPLKRPRITREDENHPTQEQRCPSVDDANPLAPIISPPIAKESSTLNGRVDEPVKDAQARLMPSLSSQRKGSIVKFAIDDKQERGTDPNSDELGFALRGPPSASDEDDPSYSTSSDSSLSSSSQTTSEDEDSDILSGGYGDHDVENQHEDDSAVHLSSPDMQARAYEEIPLSADPDSKAAQKVPGQGSRRTRARNQRRKDSKRRRFLELCGQGTAPADLPTSESTTTQVCAEEEFEIRRAELLDAIAFASENEGPDELTSRAVEGSPSRRSEQIVPQPGSHPRLDVPSSEGFPPKSLELRNSKQAADERLRSDRPNRGQLGQDDVDTQHLTPIESGSLSKSDWTAKIELSAVECVDERVELSAPPFPFLQRWDSQYRPFRNRSIKRKRERAGLPYDERDGVGVQIEDAFESGEDVWVKTDTTCLKDADTREEVFPPLPQDLGELPILNTQGCQIGAIIVFKLLEVSQATNWQPAISQPKTATIEHFEHETSTLTVTLAQRDRPSHEYDSDGKRVFQRFEMPIEAGEDADADAQLELPFSELIDPKLLIEGSAGDQESGEEANNVKQDQSQTNVIQTGGVGGFRQV